MGQSWCDVAFLHWFVPPERVGWFVPPGTERRAQVLRLDDRLLAAAGLPGLADRRPGHVLFAERVSTRFGLPGDAGRPATRGRPAPPASAAARPAGPRWPGPSSPACLIETNRLPTVEPAGAAVRT
jgi:hypothetical protein